VALWDPRALHLAQLCDANVDAPKTGRTWPVPPRYAAEVVYPTYMLPPGSRARGRASRSAWGRIVAALQAHAADASAETAAGAAARARARADALANPLAGADATVEEAGDAADPGGALAAEGWAPPPLPPASEARPHPLLAARAQRMRWWEWRALAHRHMAAFARDVFSGPPRDWRPRGRADAPAGELAWSGAEADAEADGGEDEGGSEIGAASGTEWASEEWSVGITAAPFSAGIGVAVADGGGIGGNIGGNDIRGGSGSATNIAGNSSDTAGTARWAHSREWARPRARARLFADGAAARPERARRALALAYYMVGFRPRREPAAFAWAVADDLLCQEARAEEAAAATTSRT